jgi:hypothetical protein
VWGADGSITTIRCVVPLVPGMTLKEGLAKSIAMEIARDEEGLRIALPAPPGARPMRHRSSAADRADWPTGAAALEQITTPRVRSIWPTYRCDGACRSERRKTCCRIRRPFRLDRQIPPMLHKDGVFAQPIRNAASRSVVSAQSVARDVSAIATWGVENVTCTIPAPQIRTCAIPGSNL